MGFLSVSLPFKQILYLSFSLYVYYFKIEDRIEEKAGEKGIL